MDVLKVERNVARPGCTIETSEGVIEANRGVAATGPFQRPVIPPIAPKDRPFLQIHSADYRNPAHQLGVSSEPGVYLLGLAWQSRRGTSFIWGV